MFSLPRHQKIALVLQTFDADVLRDAECYFGGGTAIVLGLGEYRESVDIDFLCASSDGYRKLRNIVGSGLGALLKKPITHLREVRTDQYKIWTILEVDKVPVKVEIVREGRVSIQPDQNGLLGVPLLSRDDLYCQKLLANADRGLDRALLSRDIIDLAMMIRGWGAIPPQSWEKARAAYGDQLMKAFHRCVGLVSDPDYLQSCLRKMNMDETLAAEIIAALNSVSATMPSGMRQESGIRTQGSE